MVFTQSFAGHLTQGKNEQKAPVKEGHIDALGGCVMD